MMIDATVVLQTPQTAVPPTPPAAPVLGGQTSIEALQAQLVDLNVQLAGLTAERSGLRYQLERMLQSNPARPQVQAKDAEVGLKLANVEGQIATVKAQIASKQGVPITEPPRIPGSRRDTPTEAKMAFTLALVLLIPLSMAMARRIWRGAPRPVSPAPDPEVAMRLGRLEQAVDTIAIEIERISEGQRFMTKIMAERATPQPAHSAAAAEAASVEQPLRALGAGPLEPVPIPNRQGVRPSITPH
jgi:hypothetical protein